ncbi:PREDICTED: cap-specific mRNA (nucleoside-2'-O-)-methyltransferase 1-like, partial [Amphimedon queenslandica]|uniref:Cap-specific mRNA (nucleoside-2'-O-)-methyltransferase 1 n=2 Tax=Amphimedon queenslandica TaxID=400682 RepID=A0AAN0J3M7_AMPQE
MATSPLNRKRSYSSSSSTSSGTNSTSSEEIHLPVPESIKLDDNSPSYNEERRFLEKSSTSTTDSDHDSVSDWEPEKKKRKRALYDDNEGKNKPEPSYSTFSLKMMASMGYKPGLGLGKTHTGITAPIEESLQKGRRGLGLCLEGLEKEDVKWEQEEVDCHQVPVWLPPCEEPVLTDDDIHEWITIGARKTTIDDETLYCDEKVLEKILQSKTVFDSLDDKEFLEARQRANPFETIKGAIFQNRAAMKMANIDSVFDFMFTKGFKLSPNDVLYFADICAGPGGFSEYVFWRKKWHAKGFGMTLKEPDSGFDFKLDSFIAGPCETFDPHYGVGGYSGNGDITDPNNLEEFQSYVLQNTDNTGVHFVMADGGASVEGQENIQEILMKQLVLCQYLCALSILRTGETKYDNADI